MQAGLYVCVCVLGGAARGKMAASWVGSVSAAGDAFGLARVLFSPQSFVDPSVLF